MIIDYDNANDNNNNNNNNDNYFDDNVMMFSNGNFDENNLAGDYSITIIIIIIIPILIYMIIIIVILGRSRNPIMASVSNDLVLCCNTALILNFLDQKTLKYYYHYNHYHDDGWVTHLQAKSFTHWLTKSLTG